jgi:hypothetical protein
MYFEKKIIDAIVPLNGSWINIYVRQYSFYRMQCSFQSMLVGSYVHWCTCTCKVQLLELWWWNRSSIESWIYIYITWYHKFPVIFYWKIQHIYLQTLSSFSNECALCTLVQEKILVNKCVIGSDLVMRKGRRWVFY